MKRLRFIILLALLVFAVAASSKAVDFNYPATVTRNASNDLKRALKSGDGEKAVDALVRYSIAQSQVDEENIDDIMQCIDDAIASEKQPHIKALMLVLQAKVLEEYDESPTDQLLRSVINYNDEEYPKSYTEYNIAQKHKKQKELMNRALSYRNDLLKVPVNSLPGIICVSPLGAQYVPTLYQFVLAQKKELIRFIEKDEYDDWLKSVEGNVLAQIYAESLNQVMKVETYEKYRDNEHSALLLDIFDSEDSVMLKFYEDYLQRFPDGFYSKSVQRSVDRIKKKTVKVVVPNQVSRNETIKGNVILENTSRCVLTLSQSKKVPLPGGQKNIVWEPIQTIEIECDSTGVSYPYILRKDFEIGGLDIGRYRLSMKINHDGKEFVDTTRHAEILVSDLNAFSVQLPSEHKLFVVDNHTGAPVPGATVNTDGIKTVTGDDGSVLVNDSVSMRSTRNVYVSLGNDVHSVLIDFAPRFSAPSKYLFCDVFTDLAIYRPGETVNWAVVMHNAVKGKRNIEAGVPVRVALKENLYEDEIIAKTGVLYTDSTGRVQGSFVLPTDMLNQSYYITVLEGLVDEDNDAPSSIGYKAIELAEYKVPTFEVTMGSKAVHCQEGQPVKVSCQAKTFEGMPVAGATVDFMVYEQLYWWKGNKPVDKLSYVSFHVVTDKDGFASIEIPLKNENNRGKYIAQASCTSVTGEMHKCAQEIYIGSLQGITFNEQNIVCNANEQFKAPIAYKSTCEGDTTTTVAYKLTDRYNGNVVHSGTMLTHDPVIGLDKVPSGVYFLEACIVGADSTDEASTARTVMTVYRPTDDKAPVKNVPLWTPSLRVKSDNHGMAHVIVANSVPESHVYCIVEAGDTVVSAGWRKFEQGMHTIDVQVPQGEQRCTLLVMSNYDNTFYGKTIEILCEERVPEFQIVTSSFRDKIVPGANERWTLRLTGKNGSPAPGHMMLEMIDKAVDKLKPNRFEFTAPDKSNVSRISYNKIGQMYYEGNINSNPVHSATVQTPELYLYGQELFLVPEEVEPRSYVDDVWHDQGSRYYPSFYSYGLSTNIDVFDDYLVRALSGRAAGVSVVNAPKIKVRGATSVYGYSAPVVDLDDVAVRMSKVKTSLWRPMLSSDSDGNIEVEFTAPEDNTTWIVQALAFNKDMLTSKMLREVITQRPVMVKSHLPRYVRSGDKASLTAMVMNATNAAAATHAVAEVFNPRTGQVYATHSFSDTITSRGSQTLTVQWDVPDSIAYVGFRIKAAAGTHSDGEQMMLPVLPCEQMVTEVVPFGLGMNNNDKVTLTVPGNAGNAQVALQYSISPITSIFSALPSIYSDTPATSIHLAHSLFAIDMARGMRDRYHLAVPDTATVLDNNAQLRIGTIKASPWVGDSVRMKQRILALARLNDDAHMDAQRKKLMDKLLDMQHDDGSWSWCNYPNAPGSFYCTATVLELMGEVKQQGMLRIDKKLDKALANALAYCDSVALLPQWSSAMPQMVYLHTLYPNAKVSKSMRGTISKEVKGMAKGWNKQSLTLADKAYWAMALERNGEHKAALQLTKSIREFAVKSPVIGTYWNSVDNGWLCYDKVAVTAVIVKALHEVEGYSDDVYGAQLWMLAMKQSNDWGSSSLAADAVYALLSTSQNIPDADPHRMEVKVDGKRLDADFSQEGILDIDAAPGSTVSVSSGGQMLWGALYSKYNNGMSETEAASTPELSISKEYLVYDSENNLVRKDVLSLGDRVQVRITVKNLRDLDYVTVIDERASCLEPSDQLSGYRYASGLWQYLETKDSSTRFYITSLDKGTHVITYDTQVIATGTYSAGIATIQCQLAPQATAHTAGATLTVTK